MSGIGGNAERTIYLKYSETVRDTVYQILAHTYESASPFFYQASDMPGITVSKREQYKKSINNGINACPDV